jgi:hypothetical protein
MNVRIADPHNGIARPLRRPALTQLLSFGRTNPGAWNADGARSQFFGAMDDIRMYSTALTLEQIIHEHSTIEVEVLPSPSGFIPGYAFDPAGLVVKVENDFYNLSQLRTYEYFRFYIEVDGELVEIVPGELLPTEIESDLLTVNIALLDNTLVRTSFEIEISDCPLRQELREAIAYVEALNASDFTRGSWIILHDTLVMARAVYNNQQAGDGQIKNAIEHIQSGIENLVKVEPPVTTPIDEARESLGEAIEEAQGFVISQFTRGNWILLQDTLAIARVAYGNTNATLGQLEQALLHLNAAIGNRNP